MIFLFHVFFICSSCIYHCFPPLFFFSSGGYRYLRPLVAAVAVVAKCHLSALYRHEKGKLFAQLVDLLQFYEKFEINDHAGTQLTDDEVLQCNYDRFLSFQLLAFKKIPKVCF
jgi:intron-binding protein aquarius